MTWKLRATAGSIEKFHKNTQRFPRSCLGFLSRQKHMFCLFVYNLKPLVFEPRFECGWMRVKQLLNHDINSDLIERKAGQRRSTTNMAIAMVSAGLVPHIGWTRQTIFLINIIGHFQNVTTAVCPLFIRLFIYMFFKLQQQILARSRLWFRSGPSVL